MIKPLFALGTTEIIVIILIIIVLFGAKKIPELMRGVGKGVKEFKDAVNGEVTEEENNEEKPSEKDFDELDSKSPKFKKLHTEIAGAK